MFKVGIIQMNSTSDVTKNLKYIKSQVNSMAKDVDLVVLPEHSDGIGVRDEDFAHSIPGKITDFFSSLARDNSVYLHCGSIAEKGVNGKPYNTSVLFDKNGIIVSKYSKLHLFDVDLPDGTGCRESDTATAGDSIVVAKTDLASFGMAICYDIRFPELFRSMALDGANVMLVCANFTAPTGEYHWLPLLKARAIENGCYVIAVNQCGTKPQFEAYGHSIVIDPWGRVLVELGTECDNAIIEIDTDYVNEVRNKIPSLKNRRTDVY